MALKCLYGVLLLLLASCASVPPQPALNTDEAERSRVLNAQSHWAFSGRMAYASAGQGGSAQLQWQQRGAVSDVRINVPLALASVRIRFDATQAQAQVLDGDGRVLQSGKPDELLQKWLPVPIPIADLAPGLRAFWPESSALTNAAASGKVELSGWLWQYTQWQNAPVRLPGKLEISREGTRLRLVIDRWQDVPHE
jgi:outer membrane biogenesis lipoprotein LolB